MMNLNLKNLLKKTLAMQLGLVASKSLAANQLPFVSSMDTLKDAISGPFLSAGAIIMVVITCLMLAFGEWGDGFKRIINIVLWLSVAFAATSFVTSLFSSS